MSASGDKTTRYGVDRSAELSLDEVLIRLKKLLLRLIREETAHFNTRATWRCFLHVLDGKFSRPVTEFFGDHLRRIYNFFMQSIDAQSLFLRVFNWKRGWAIRSRLGGKFMSPEEADAATKELLLNKFVDDSNVTLDILLDLINVDDLKKVCKELKINNSKLTRDQTIDTIRLFCKSQRGLFDTGNLDARVIKIIKNIIGGCFEPERSFCVLLLGVLCIYCPFTADSKRLEDPKVILIQHELYFALHRIKMRDITPLMEAEKVTRLCIYRDINHLFEYVEAMQLEASLLKIPREDSQTALELTRAIKRKLIRFMDSLSVEGSDLPVYYDSLPDYLLRYTAPWVYVRCMQKGAEVYQSLKEYREANYLFSMLLNRDCLKRFHSGERGAFYDRIALNLHIHMKDKVNAIKVCHVGIEDPMVPNKHKLMLQIRAQKIFKKYPVVIELAKFETIKITGNVLGKKLDENRQNYFIEKNGTTGGFDHLSVEEVALRHFLQNGGYNEGFHTEGRVWHLLYFLVFWDIIFDSTIKSVWISEIQTLPLDRNSPDFYKNRASAITKRIDEIENDPDMISQYAEQTFTTRFGQNAQEVDWSRFAEVNHLKGFIKCCPPKVLIEIFLRFSKDNRHSRSGFPDLVVWNTEDHTIAVIEVKGPNDRPSTKQLLWLDFFSRHDGIRSILCNVEARKKRVL